MENKTYKLQPYGQIKAFKNDYISSFFEQGKMWEPEIYEIYKRDIVPNTIVIDCGAFIGTHSLLMAQSPGVTVLAFEPTYESYKLLLDNIQLNNCHNIIPFNMACSDTYQVLNINKVKMDADKMHNYGGNQICDHGNPVWSMPVYLIPMFTKVSFIKIDVEGYEIRALNGFKPIIEDHKPNVLVEIWKHKLDEFPFDWFKQLGYTCQDLGTDNYYFTYICSDGC